MIEEIEYPDDEEVELLLSAINSSLPTLENIQKTYSDDISSVAVDASTIEFGNWEDDVQKKIKTRTDNFKKEVNNIEISINEEHLPILISKLKNLQSEILEMKKCMNKYYKYDEEYYSSWADGETRKIYGEDITEDKAKEKMNYYWDKSMEYIYPIKKLIKYISLIDFGISLDSIDEESLLLENEQTSSESNDLYLSYKEGQATIAMDYTETETDTEIIYERTVTRTNSDGSVEVINHIKITVDKENPGNKTVEDNGAKYTKTVNEAGLTIETVSLPGQRTYTNKSGPEMHTLTINNKTYDYDSWSSADKAFAHLMIEVEASRQTGKYDRNGTRANQLVTSPGSERVGNSTITVRDKY